MDCGRHGEGMLTFDAIVIIDGVTGAGRHVMIMVSEWLSVR